jgi:hypothetical protein
VDVDEHISQSPRVVLYGLEPAGIAGPIEKPARLDQLVGQRRAVADGRPVAVVAGRGELAANIREHIVRRVRGTPRGQSLFRDEFGHIGRGHVAPVFSQNTRHRNQETGPLFVVRMRHLRAGSDLG